MSSLSEHERAIALRMCVANYANELIVLDNLLAKGMTETARARIAEIRNSNGANMGWKPELGNPI